ncbi:MAG: phosphatidylglycerophosphatase A [Desulfosudaceae bacterium]
MTLTRKITVMLATGLYSGKMPFAPGTFGTLAGLVPVYFLSLLSPPAALVVLAAAVAVSVVISHRAEQLIGGKDPGCIVLDEIVGVMAALWGFSFSPVPVVAGFLIFRLLDIIKPFPIRQIEKKLPGGAGIVADDVAAGIMTNIIMRLVAGLV